MQNVKKEGKKEKYRKIMTKPVRTTLVLGHV